MVRIDAETLKAIRGGLCGYTPPAPPPACPPCGGGGKKSHKSC